MEGFNKNKFSFRELTMNSNGKQSGSGFLGVLSGLVGLFSFVALTFGYFFQLPNTLEMMTNVILLMGISSTLLGIRKISGNNKPQN